MPYLFEVKVYRFASPGVEAGDVYTGRLVKADPTAAKREATRIAQAEDLGQEGSWYQSGRIVWTKPFVGGYARVTWLNDGLSIGAKVEEEAPSAS